MEYILSVAFLLRKSSQYILKSHHSKRWCSWTQQVVLIGLGFVTGQHLAIFAVTWK